LRESVLDEAVIGSILQELLTPDFVQAIVGAVFERRNKGRSNAVESLSRLKAEEATAARRLRAMWKAVADEIMGEDDIFREQYGNLREERISIGKMIAVHERTLAEALKPLTDVQSEFAAARLRQALLGADGKLKRRFVRALVSEVVVGAETVDIYGPESGLAELATGTAFSDAPSARAEVRGSVQAWCPRSDSNQHDLAANRF
jgi:hypothetical protein